MCRGVVLASIGTSASGIPGMAGRVGSETRASQEVKSKVARRELGNLEAVSRNDPLDRRELMLAFTNLQHHVYCSCSVTYTFIVVLV